LPAYETQWTKPGNNTICIEYYWKFRNNWNYLKAIAAEEPQSFAADTEETFITEHYWGYTSLSPVITGEYQVTHPQWRIHPVHSYQIHCDAAALYGNEFAEPLCQNPSSVFLAEGSDISVLKGKKIFQ